MTTNAADYLALALQTAAGVSGNRRKVMIGELLLTTSGAASTDSSDEGVTGAKSAGTGIYTFTFPVSKRLVVVGVGYIQASGVAIHPVLTSRVASTGVVTITLAQVTGDPGAFAAVDGTSGDTITCVAIVEYD